MEMNNNPKSHEKIGSSVLVRRSAERLRLATIPRCASVAYVGPSRKKFLWFCSALRATGLPSSNIVHIDMLNKLRIAIVKLTLDYFFVDDTSSDELEVRITVEVIKRLWPDVCVFVITSNATRDRRVDLLRSGANIVISEDDCSPTDIAYAISAEANGLVNLHASPLCPTAQQTAAGRQQIA